MSKVVDMTGQRIGNFLIIKRVIDASYPKARWLCLCDCGNYFECSGDTLRSKKHPISCPQCAMDKKNKKKVKNLIGMRFGHLQVMSIEKDKDNHYKQLCKCDCGNSILVDSYSLLSKTIQSCGCQNPFLNAEAQKNLSLSRVQDLSNQRFGLWTVLEYDSNVKKWKCKCDCGNVSYVPTYNLKSGKSKSCGCQRNKKLQKERLIDMTGMRFGMLTVLSIDSKEKGKKWKWLCQCDCGEQTLVTGSDLRSMQQVSCGCLKSKGELLIKQFLIKNQIPYQSQKTFDGLIGVGGRLLSYDFYLPDYKLLIEFQGEQHYSPCKIFGGENQFNKQLEHDKRKREYASENNYRLLEIEYTQIDNIVSILSKSLGIFC